MTIPTKTNVKGRKPLIIVQPKNVLRPHPITPPPIHWKSTSEVDQPLPYELWIKIFSLLPRKDLWSCLLVNKTWNCWAMHSSLWAMIDLSNQKMSAKVLHGIIRRQPDKLNLASTNISGHQLEWLLQRLPRLQHLDLRLNTVAAVIALTRVVCPPLQFLDLSWCGAIYDHSISMLLSNAKIGSVPMRNRSRMYFVKDLRLSGCDISDESVISIFKTLASLESLDISYCALVTDTSIQILLNKEVLCSSSLDVINITGCSQISASCVEEVLDFNPRMKFVT